MIEKTKFEPQQLEQPLDGSFVHRVDNLPVKELSDADLKRHAELLAANTQTLIQQQMNAISHLVHNELTLNVITFEINRRKSLTVPAN